MCQPFVHWLVWVVPFLHGFPPGREADEPQRYLEVISKEPRNTQTHFSITNSLNDKNIFHLTRKLTPTLPVLRWVLRTRLSHRPQRRPLWTPHPLSVALSAASLNEAFDGHDLWALATGGVALWTP